MKSALRSLGFLIHETDRLLIRRFERFAATTGLSRAQWQVLARVAKMEGINQASLADLTGVEPITICRMVDRLEGLGYLERRSDPNDRRAKLIYTTEQARPAIESMRAVAADIFAGALEGFDAEETQTLLALLERVYDNLQAGAAPPLPGEAEGPRRESKATT
ncbi:MarR family winged helix-turn-helix transcriptional regulator [Oryzibacter oryziterrae]|uniref:MarR family winged helix-turn-helix transcriptional regulator n=1 Tax=Oryzibacter oryziterrae TaxID=2766474 RepID=UPI001F216F8A|nr:MarR family transcriptional regulator [Oryzibacter oryziterrae]